MNTQELQFELIQKLRKPYGQHYNNNDRNKNNNLEIKQITKNIRKELKALTKLGFKFSVRGNSRTIRVKVLIVPEDWIIFNPHYNQELAWKISVGQITSWYTEEDPREVYTELGKQFGKTLRSIANQWNYDNSDSYSDYYEYNYFLTVTTESGLML